MGEEWVGVGGVDGGVFRKGCVVGGRGGEGWGFGEGRGDRGRGEDVRGKMVKYG